MPSTPNLFEDYTMLGVKNDATADEVRQAYRDLAKIWHPDRFSPDDSRLRKKAEDKFKEINAAYARIQEAHSQSQQQTDSQSKQIPLHEAVLEAQMLMTTLNVRTQTLNTQMFLVSMMKAKGASTADISAQIRDIRSEVESCLLMADGAITRSMSVISRVEREAPESSKGELESLKAALAGMIQIQAKIKDVAFSIGLVLSAKGESQLETSN